MRLADAIMVGRARPPEWAWQDDSRHALKHALNEDIAALTDVPVFDASNVAEYLFSTRESRSLTDPDAFPSIAPPFDAMWVEYRVPPTAQVRDDKGRWTEVDTARWPVQRWGGLIRSERLDGGGWLLQGTAYVLTREKKAIGPVGTWKALADPLGHMVDAEAQWEHMEAAALPDEVETRLATYEETRDEVARLKTAGQLGEALAVADRAYQEAVAELGRVTWQQRRLGLHVEDLRAIAATPDGFVPVAKTLCYLNCKNVIHEAEPQQPKLARRHVKRHGVEPLVYRTIIVDPDRAHGGATGGSGGGEKKRFHIVRGHFADYREGGGLFGRLHGIYWVPAHVRGDREKGTADKDYKVRPTAHIDRDASA